jgi:penicillin-binding protein 1C
VTGARRAGLRAVRAGLSAATLATLIGVLVFAWWVESTLLPPTHLTTSVELRASDGQLLHAFTVDDGRWRLGQALEGVDAGYLALLIAYEDRRFYTHRGVDVRALARAAWGSLRAGRIVSGGSTLTMQVARLLEEGGTGSWAGKLRQIRVALALERRLSKGEILSLYLHLAPMGGNLQGVRAGSLAWFGKEPTRLTEAEAALLVALPQAPALRHPENHPATARAARERVLLRGTALGIISAEAAAAARRDPLPRARIPFPNHAPHLAERLRQRSPSVSVHHTTLDAELQGALEVLARAALRNLPEPATVAMLVADIDSGAILATVGSADPTSDARRGFVDMTQALRSPGSTLKPLIYALAFSEVIAHPETILQDRPTDYAGYAPRNFEAGFRGPVSAREALQASLNLPVVALTEGLGPARLLAAVRQAGVEAVVPGDTVGLAISLGGIGVTLEGLVQLYAAIARGGEAVALTTTPGEHRAHGRLVNPSSAWHVGDILGSGPRPTNLPNWPIAFKTGTSHGFRDGLALGYDGAHAVGVWTGRADGNAVPGLTGGSVAAPLLFEALAHLGAAPIPLPPAPPGTLVVGHAELPPALQHYGVRLSGGPHDFELAFPPDGAALLTRPDGVFARVERGTAPFSWFANGVPVLLGSFEREAYLPISGPGFVALSVVDAQGRAARVSVELRP